MLETYVMLSIMYHCDSGECKNIARLLSTMRFNAFWVWLTTIDERSNDGGVFYYFGGKI